MKKLLLIIFLFGAFAGKSQRVESIHFNLYTDSLKKGVHNYISVDGKLSNGNFYPLMTDEIVFTSSAGKWDGNSIIIDSSIALDSVIITATLKSNASIKKNVVIYIKKSLFEGELKTEKELLEQWKEGVRNKAKKKT